jgi:GT2 family glycosyltransferase
LTSWKVTAPLRVAKRGLHWFGRLPSFGRALIRNAASCRFWVRATAALLPPTPKKARSIILAHDVPQAGLAVAGQREGIMPAEVLREMTGRKLEGPAAKRHYDELGRSHFAAFLESGRTLAVPARKQPKVSVVLVLYNRAELTYLCLSSLVWSADLPVETIIVDNASSDQTGTLLDRIVGAKVIRNGDNVGFLKAVNQGLREAAGDHVLLLNNDALLFPGALSTAVRTLESKADIGAVGGRIVMLDGRLQEAGCIIWNDGSIRQYGRDDYPNAPAYLFRRDVDYCSGAFLLVRRDLFLELGGFDETFAPAYYEETDLCMRLRQRGYRVVYEPNAVILHYEFASSASMEHVTELGKINQEKFAAKHEVALGRHSPPDLGNVLIARSAERDRPRLLLLDDRVPHRWLGSGFPRANDIVDGLVTQGYFVTIYPMTMPDEELADLYTDLPREVEVICGEGYEKLETFLKDRANYYDTILISRPHNMKIFSGIYDRNRDLLQNVRIIYDAEAIFALRDLVKQRLEGAEPPKGKVDDMVRAETDLARCADKIVAVSPVEAAEFTKRGFQNVHVLGHRVAAYPSENGFEARQGILFVGAIHADDTPNADSVLWFAEKVWPILQNRLPGMVEFVVAGTNRSQAVWSLSEGRIRVCGFVDDLGALYDRYRIFVAPTRYAAGIPYKVHESAAQGLPVVATSLIAGQLGWTAGEHLLAAEGPEDFARQCLTLYEDKATWQAIRDGALKRIEDECSEVSFHTSLAAIVKDSEGIRMLSGGGGALFEQPERAD